MQFKSKRRCKPWCPIASGLLVAAIAIGVVFAQHKSYPLQYQPQVLAACAETLVEPALLFAVIHTESRFNPMAESAVGARGLTQIMPDTFAWLQSKVPPPEPLEFAALYEENVAIHYGALLLHLLLQEFHGEVATAVAAYHAGRGRINQWLQDPSLSPDGIRLTSIPTPETKHYVRKVLHAYSIYQRKLNKN